MVEKSDGKNHARNLHFILAKIKSNVACVCGNLFSSVVDCISNPFEQGLNLLYLTPLISALNINRILKCKSFGGLCVYIYI